MLDCQLAYLGSSRGRPRHRRSHSGRRRGPAPIGRSRPGAGRPHRLGPDTGGRADRVFRQAAESSHRPQRPPHPPGRAPRVGAAGEIRISSSSTARSRKRSFAPSSTWSPSASRAALASTRERKSRSWHPHAPRVCWAPRTSTACSRSCSTPPGAHPSRKTGGRLRSRRPGDADTQQLRPRGLQRRHWEGSAGTDKASDEVPPGRFRSAPGRLRAHRSRRADPGLRLLGPQIPGQRVPLCHPAGPHPALHPATTKSPSIPG